MLQTLVRGEAVFSAVTTLAELADVERVRALVFVLEVTLERVVAAERAAAVRAFLRLVYAAAGRWRHAIVDDACNKEREGVRRGVTR